MMEAFTFEDRHGNIWRLTLAGWELLDTRQDRRPSLGTWHPGRGETKRGERVPPAPVRPVTWPREKAGER